jgi:hypothetical protein
VLALGLAWLIVLVCVSYFHMAPAYVKKVVTISIKNTGQVRLIFSAAQPENEIVYTVKSQWYELLESAGADYVGREIDTPYRDYVRTQWHKILPIYTAVTLALAILLIFWIYCKKHLLRIWNKRSQL